MTQNKCQLGNQNMGFMGQIEPNMGQNIGFMGIMDFMDWVDTLHKVYNYWELKLEKIKQ